MVNNINKQTTTSHFKSLNTKRPRHMSNEIHNLAWDNSKCMAAQSIRSKSCPLELSYHSEKLHFTMTSKGTFLANLVAGHAVVLKNKLKCYSQSSVWVAILHLDIQSSNTPLVEHS